MQIVISLNNLSGGQATMRRWHLNKDQNYEKDLVKGTL